MPIEKFEAKFEGPYDDDLIAAMMNLGGIDPVSLKRIADEEPCGQGDLTPEAAKQLLYLRRIYEMTDEYNARLRQAG